MAKFRLFLRQQRGQPALALPTRTFEQSHYCAGLPNWLVDTLSHYQRLMQAHWRPDHLDSKLASFWNSHTHLWRWLFARYPIVEVADIKRQYLLDYFDDCLAKKYAISTINSRLHDFQSVLRYLQEQEEVLVPQVLLRLPGLKLPDRLPRFLTDEQVRKVRDDLEVRVGQVLSFPTAGCPAGSGGVLSALAGRFTAGGSGKPAPGRPGHFRLRSIRAGRAQSDRPGW
ncbi:MAG: hypothetical protein U0401_22895 [Anaerolineae bacterium]